MACFLNELIQIYAIYYFLVISHKKISFWVIFWKSQFLKHFRTKFYGGSVEEIVEYLYVTISFNYIFMVNSAYIYIYIYLWCYRRDLVVQDFCHSPRCPRYKSTTLKMPEFRHMCRSWQCPPNFFFLY